MSDQIKSNLYFPWPTSFYFKRCQIMLGLDLPYLHYRHFTTGVSHFLHSSFVLHSTLWQVARKTFIGLNLVVHVSLLYTNASGREAGGTQWKQFVENTEIESAHRSHSVESQCVVASSLPSYKCFVLCCNSPSVKRKQTSCLCWSNDKLLYWC